MDKLAQLRDIHLPHYSFLYETVLLGLVFLLVLAVFGLAFWLWRRRCVFNRAADEALAILAQIAADTASPAPKKISAIHAVLQRTAQCYLASSWNPNLRGSAWINFLNQYAPQHCNFSKHSDLLLEIAYHPQTQVSLESLFIDARTWIIARRKRYV